MNSFTLYTTYDTPIVDFCQYDLNILFNEVSPEEKLWISKGNGFGTLRGNEVKCGKTILRDWRLMQLLYCLLIAYINEISIAN